MDSEFGIPRVPCHEGQATCLEGIRSSNYTRTFPSIASPLIIQTSMSNAMCITGIVSGLLIAVIFLADLISNLPFGIEHAALEIGFIISGLMIAYLGWTALKEAR